MSLIKKIMTSKNAKTILFAGIIAAMILPFSMMNHAQADVDSEDIAKITKLFEKAQKVADKITKIENKQRTSKDPSVYDEKLERLKVKFAKIDAKINKLAPITENIIGEVVDTSGSRVTRDVSTERYVIVNDSKTGCDKKTQVYSSKMSLSPPTEKIYWNIDYPSKISVGFNPVCWDSSWITYDINIHNHSDGWACAINTVTTSDNVFPTICSGHTLSDGDLVKFVVRGLYTNWTIEHTKFVVI